MKRIVWIDIAKIIGIYFVVLGHALHKGSGAEGFVKDFIYIYHMPLFFFLSGYLFSAKTSFTSFLKKNIKSLIIPYFFLNVTALTLLIPVYIHGHHNIPDLLIRIIIGDGHAPAGPAWFLLSLFWIRLMAYFYTKIDKTLKIIFLVGVICTAYISPYNTILRFDSAFMAFPFFILGTIIKRYDINERKLDGIHSKGIFYIVPFLLLIMTLCVTFYQRSTSIYSLNFGQHPFFYYIGAIIGITMIISFCRLYPHEQMNKFWNTIASGTIVIMGLHGVFYIYINNIFPHFLDGMWRPIIICAIVVAVMYYPILFLKKYCKQFIGS